MIEALLFFRERDDEMYPPRPQAAVWLNVLPPEGATMQLQGGTTLPRYIMIKSIEHVADTGWFPEARPGEPCPHRVKLYVMRPGN